MAIYRDFDLNFRAHPVTGDLVMLDDDRAVMQALRNLIQTNESEIVMEPEIYGGADDLIFELNTSLLEFNLTSKIQEVIANHEPRIEVIDVTVTGKNSHTVTVAITYYFLNQPNPITDTITLNRTR